MQVLIVLSACLAAASAIDCPIVNVTLDFDIEAFSGVWYQQKYSLGSIFTQGYSRCAFGTWTKVNDTALYMVNKEKGLLGNWQTVEGYAILKDPTLGNFTTTFSTVFGTNTYQLHVLTTDYVNYAITFSCLEFLGVPLNAAWITTRVQNPTGEEKTKLDALIQAGIDSVDGLYNSDFYTTGQDNCS